MRDDRGLLEVVLGDGRFLIALTGISLALAGGFAILQSVSGQLLRRIVTPSAWIRRR
jgi:hypothetical protein